MAEKRTIRDLLVRLGVVADTTSVEDFDRAVGVAKKTMLGLSAAVLAGATALTGLGASMVQAARDTAALGDQAAKTAQRVGTTAETIQELEYAAERYGAPAGAVEKSLKRLAANAYDAERGLAAANDAFADVGVDPSKFETLEDLLKGVADGIAKVDDTKQVALAQKLLGRGGADLLPLLRQGSGEIKALAEEAQRLGLVLSNEVAADSEAFQDASLNLSSALKGLRNEIGGALQPVLTELQDGLKELIVVYVRPAVKQFTELIERTIGWKAALGGLGVAILGLLGAGGLLALVAGAGLLAGAISSLVGAVSALMPFMVPLALAFVPLTLAIGLALAPFALIVGSIALFVLALEDLYTYLQGGDSLFGVFIDNLRTSHPEAAGIADTLVELVKTGWEFVQVLMEVGRLLGEAGWAAVVGYTTQLRDRMNEAVKAFKALTGLSFDGLVKALDPLVKVLNLPSSLKGVRTQLQGVRTGLGAISVPSNAFTPAQPASTTNNTTNNSTQAQINVNGASDPRAIALELKRRLEEQNRVMVAALPGAI